jgi:RNA-directed DNA polymerase
MNEPVDLWDKIASFESLHAGYLKARRGKRFEPETIQFGNNLEENLLSLLGELKSGAYRTGHYRRFYVHEPKLREVAALPFRDRVVQHALVAAIEPVLEKDFIDDSFACRAGKGTHAGADRLTEFLRWAHRKWLHTYVLKADVSKYFGSVEHTVLLDLLRKKITCPRTMALIEEIVYSWNEPAGRGIPIGNLTSQLFANLYLNELDHFVTKDLGREMYLRYMDDFVLLGPDKVHLQQDRYTIERFLVDHLRLFLNNRTGIFPAAQGVDFLGYRIWRTHRLLRKSSVQRMRRKLKAFSRKYAGGEIELSRIEGSIRSWIGHAGHACTYRLRQKMFSHFVLGGKDG